MSATRDLIAAALTVAGAVRWQYPELSDELRELCARAMVQPDMAGVDEALRLAVERTRDDLGPDGTNYPDVRKLLAFAEHAIADGYARAMVGPDMAEVEKLLCIHENVVRMHANGAEWDEAPSATRAALLDCVRQFAAGPHPVSTHKIIAPTDPDYAESEAYLRQQTVSAAEVPMPDVHDYGYLDSDNGWVETLACDEADARTYGDAREAAGYARGIKDAITLCEGMETLSSGNQKWFKERVLAALHRKVK